MGAETRSLEWHPRRQMQTEADGYARRLQLAPKSARAAEPGTMEGNTVPSLPASADPDVVAPAQEVVGRWKAVMLRSWTAIVTGPQSTFLDFNFVPELLDGAAPETVKQSFERFIVALFTLVGCEEGQAPRREQYVRRIDYHKLEEEKELECYT